MSRNGVLTVPMSNGHLLVGMDIHIWPGRWTTAMRAFIEWGKDMKPDIILLNGDVIDAATISRHPPIGWEGHPTVKQEMDAAREYLSEIEAIRGARLIWTLGNHDARFETKSAAEVPEYEGVFGVHLKDHFPQWEPAWKVEVGGRNGVVLQHRFKGGTHAAFNNALWSGRSVVTGHTHRLGVQPITDDNGTRFGVEGGMLADVKGAQFVAYTEAATRNWRSGFLWLTIERGRLLWPEVIHVTGPRQVEFRGTTYKI